jgi:hypothetical protein
MPPPTPTQGYLPSDVKKTLDTIVKRNQKSEAVQRKITTVYTYKRSLSDDINRIDSCLGALALSASSLFAYVPSFHARTTRHALALTPTARRLTNNDNREQAKVRDYFTKELNAIKAEHLKVEKEYDQLVEKRNSINRKKDALALTVRFLKKLP